MSAVDDAEFEMMEQICYFKNHIDCLSNDEFLDKVIETGKQLNEEIPDGNFPAYDIAKMLKSNHFKPTSKQRQALENVWVRYVMKNGMEEKK